MTTAHSVQKIVADFTLGAEHARIEAALSDTVAALKQQALVAMKIVVDPGIDYLLDYEGKRVENENETLGQLVGEHPPHTVVFVIKKRPKGGAGR